MSLFSTQLSLILKKESMLILSDFTMALICIVFQPATNDDNSPISSGEITNHILIQK